MKKALLFGATGQDGSFLAELLLSKGYEVHGVIRRSSSFNTARIEHLYQDPSIADRTFVLHYGDLTDGSSLSRLIRTVKPDEIYNLGAMSHVKVSFETPEYTCDANAMGTLRVLEAIRESGLLCKYYQASSSEMFGDSPPKQNEDTPFRPRSPYAVSKVAAYWMVKNYRESYGIFACNGILHNHESSRRGETFVTRKITKAIANIMTGQQDKLLLGNLDAQRDWGYAPEYCDAIYRMMQHDTPDDFVIATGEMHSVREFVELAFSLVDLDWSKYVVIDPRYFRPTEVDALCGDASKAKKLLGWEPKTTFQELVRIMLQHDLRSVGLSL